MSEKAPAMTSEAKAYRADLKQVSKSELLSNVEDLVDGRFSDLQVTKNNRLQYSSGTKKTDSNGVEHNVGGKFAEKANRTELEDIAAYEDQIRLGVKAKEIASVTPEIDAALDYAREQVATMNETQPTTLKEVGVMRHALVKSKAISALEVGNMSDDEVRTLVDYMHLENESAETGTAHEEPETTEPESADDSSEPFVAPNLTPIDAPASEAVIVGQLVNPTGEQLAGANASAEEGPRNSNLREAMNRIKDFPTYLAARLMTARLHSGANENQNTQERRGRFSRRTVVLGSLGTLAAAGAALWLSTRGHDTSALHDVAGNSLDTPLVPITAPGTGGGAGTGHDIVRGVAQVGDHANHFSNEALTASAGEGWTHQLHDMKIPENEIPGLLKKLAKAHDPAIREWVYTMKDGNPGIAKPGQIPANVLQSIQKLR